MKDDFTKNFSVLDYEYFYNGGGVAIGDINNDGLQDVLVTGNQVKNKLFLNKGNLQFEDITTKAGLDQQFWSTGATMADLNNDGFLDIYICNSGPDKNPETRPNQFYLNKGDLSFKECAKEFGIQDHNYSNQAAFFDYDQDGDLDLYVMNNCLFQQTPLLDIFKQLKNKDVLKASSNTFFENNGNGTFTDITEEAGLLRYGYGLGLVISDLNSDGLSDIYVSNDYDVPDFMYINMGNGTFKDQIKSKTKHISWYGMGCDIADINNDGALDIGVVDMSPNDHFRSKTLMKTMDTDFSKALVHQLKRQHQYMFNTLQVNNGDNVFSEIGLMSGIAKTDWSWTALFSDLDNDGYKDYFITNGYRKYVTDNDFQKKVNEQSAKSKQITPAQFDSLYQIMPEVKLPNVLYRNKGDLTFEDIAEEQGMEQATFSNGASIADLDNDGDLDIIVNNIDDDLLLYRNNSNKQKDRNYLQIKLEGQALQARVTVYYGDELKQVQEVSPTRGYLSAMPSLLHFGLGQFTSYDKIEVLWPDGQFQVEDAGKTNQQLSITRTKTSKSPAPSFNLLLSMESPKKMGIGYRHQENNHDDFAKEVLLPHSQSKLGPFSAIGDINNDGLDDLFLGGAKDQEASIYIQNKEGKFELLNCKALSLDKGAEDMDALFFDSNADGYLDLYIVSGGGSDFENQSHLLQDRLYINNQRGNFYKSNEALPKMLSSGSKVKAADIDSDGDLDLFIGGRTSPGQYPQSPQSYLLKNDGGRFTDVTAQQAKDLQYPGMITDFVWTDFNQDKKLDLIVVGEWMPVSFFSNDGKGNFELKNEDYPSDQLQGWWYSITAADLDKDGVEDYILGNIGLNNKFHPSQEKPLHVYANDFDENGNSDIVISSYYKGRQVPMRGKECSTQQIPGLEDKFPSFKSFANASLEEVYGKKELKESLHLKANTFASVVILNKDQGFSIHPLPNEAQFSAINRTLVSDLNQDGYQDLITVGNMYQTEFETTRYDASNGNILLGNGTGEFNPMSFPNSGFFAPFDAKDMDWIKIGPNQKPLLIISNNNRGIQFFGLK